MLLILLFQSLVLTNIVSTDVQRFDEDQNVRLEITINFTSGPSIKVPGGLYISQADLNDFKNGTLQQRNDLRKKYVRMAIKNYLDSKSTPPVVVNQGITNATKAQIQDPGDTP